MPGTKIPGWTLSSIGPFTHGNRSALVSARRCVPTRQCVRSVVVVPHQKDDKKPQTGLEEGERAAHDQHREDVDSRQYQIQKARGASQQRQQLSRSTNDARKRVPNQAYDTKVFSRKRDDRGPDSTMTDSELNTFNRLFRSIKGDSAPQRGHAGVYAEDLGYDEDRAAEDAVDLDMEQDEGVEPAIEEETTTTSTKVEAYPKALRDMARDVHDKWQKKKAKRRFTNDPQMRQMIDLTRPIMFRLVNAASDIDVWDILEQELFSKVRLLDLDNNSATKDVKAKAARVKKKQIGDENKPVADGMSKSNNTVTPSVAQSSDLHVFSKVYQRVVFHAAKILTERTSYTPLAVALLPAIKALGPSSYAMGVSSGLFNKLLIHNWRVYNSMTPMLSLLTEMDRVTCPMNSKTLEVLEEVTLYRNRAEKGNYGEAVRQLELSADRRREGREIWSWKKRIQDRLQEEALDQARRLEQERTLRNEGALGDEDENQSMLMAAV